MGSEMCIRDSSYTFVYRKDPKSVARNCSDFCESLSALMFDIQFSQHLRPQKISYHAKALLLRVLCAIASRTSASDVLFSWLGTLLIQRGKGWLDLSTLILTESPRFVNALKGSRA